MYRDPATVRAVELASVAWDGSVAYSRLGGLRAIPPPLRRGLAAQRARLIERGAKPQSRFLRGIYATRVETLLQTLQLPRSIWDDADDPPLLGLKADGRHILHRLNQIDLFHPTDTNTP